MSSPSLFIDRETGKIDTDQLLAEAIPLTKLVVLFGFLAFIPLQIASALNLGLSIGLILTVAAQVILAIGAGLILLYIITRAIHLADE